LVDFSTTESAIHFFIDSNTIVDFSNAQYMKAMG